MKIKHEWQKRNKEMRRKRKTDLDCCQLSLLIKVYWLNHGLGKSEDDMKKERKRKEK